MKRLLLLSLVAACPVFAVTPTPFATVTGPIGVAGAGNLIVTENCSQNVNSVNSLGVVSVFATLPAAGGCAEKYVAVAPAASASATPAWTPGDIFVTRGPSIYKVTAGNATLFATIPDAPAENTGITFDTVNTFGFDMIVTLSDENNLTNGGKIYRVDSTGTPTLIADTGMQTIAGPAVVPSAFGTYGGQILVADDLNDQVHAINGAGSVTLDVFDWVGAEGIHVIPNPVTTFFLASQGGNTIYKYPSTDFTGLSGGILITSTTGAGTDLVQWNGSSYDETLFDTGPGPIIEGGAFTTLIAASPTPTPTATATATVTPTVTPTPTPSEKSYAEVQ